MPSRSAPGRADLPDVGADVDLPGVVGVRDSKDPTGPALAFAPATWAAFVGGVKGQRRG
ncbi:DUF397 domain-containing protein [Micromonospora sp. NPDC049230]|uniref:DUF397 domain-containing protein n=1 Tax=Micromonospora sp. NPDC049230 TaxID=3155502 RepID=UPI0033FE20B4